MHYGNLFKDYSDINFMPRGILPFKFFINEIEKLNQGIINKKESRLISVDKWPFERYNLLNFRYLGNVVLMKDTPFRGDSNSLDRDFERLRLFLNHFRTKGYKNNCLDYHPFFDDENRNPKKCTCNPHYPTIFFDVPVGSFEFYKRYNGRKKNIVRSEKIFDRIFIGYKIESSPFG